MQSSGICCCRRKKKGVEIRNLGKYLKNEVKDAFA
jgi:hypothetical protein